ncbi:hypothetical protein OG413_41395 [Streptomyces sp. NBC_01433]|uniref:hypothetical protein n=1 Tax=Streptomyces sp. NBC_01433 TaxID=2903864 RepID=UPI0022505E6F|nr:hypothetical protein [Streptomyces sp. NBC_01433]MCX4681659.1 hypothetical protein [Streptomyces sp. NBC_01433]
MATYNVPLTGIANITVTVTTDETDPNKIATLAVEKAEAEAISLCRQCASDLNNSLDIGDDWRPVTDDRTNASEAIKISD